MIGAEPSLLHLALAEWGHHVMMLGLSQARWGVAPSWCACAGRGRWTCHLHVVHSWVLWHLCRDAIAIDIRILLRRWPDLLWHHDTTCMIRHGSSWIGHLHVACLCMQSKMLRCAKGLHGLILRSLRGSTSLLSCLTGRPVLLPHRVEVTHGWLC